MMVKVIDWLKNNKVIAGLGAAVLAFAAWKMFFSKKKRRY